MIRGERSLTRFGLVVDARSKFNNSGTWCKWPWATVTLPVTRWGETPTSSIAHDDAVAHDNGVTVVIVATESGLHSPTHHERVK